MAVQNDFSKGSILSHMARIALPMTLAQFVNILYNIIAVSYTHLDVYKRQATLQLLDYPL